MARNPIDDQIRTRIDAFVEEISTLVREAAVAAVQDALQSGAPAQSAPGARRGRKPARKAAGRKAGRKAPGRKPGPRSGKRIRRSADDLERMGTALFDHVRRNPGSRMEQISAALGEDTKDLRRPVQMLVDAGRLRTQGQKRATQYYAGAGKARAAKKPARKARKKKASRRKTRGQAR